MLFQTEYEFNLPKGYVDEAGTIHKSGRMRLATAKDELQASHHPKVKASPQYMSTVVLSYVITELGTLHEVTPEIIEQLFTSDMNFLENMYQTINQSEDAVIHVTCPYCGKRFTDTVDFTRID